jgi:hypothetical protein
MLHGTFDGRPYSFPVDEVAEPSEEQTRRPRERQGVGDLPERHPMHAREERTGDGHAQQRTMKREPAMPKAKELEWVAEKVAGLVDDRVDGARADQHSRHQVAEQRVEVALRHRDQPARDPRPGDPEADDIPDEIHHTVSSDRKRTDPDELRRDVRVRNGHRIPIDRANSTTPMPALAVALAIRATPTHRRQSCRVHACDPKASERASRPESAPIASVVPAAKPSKYFTAVWEE